MAECNGCGACCDPVVLPESRIGYQTAPRGAVDPANLRWVLQDLTPITRREGIERTKSYMKDGGRTHLGNIHDSRGTSIIIQHSFYFECRHYDRDTRTCQAYERRPPMCSGFPWYGLAPDETKAIPVECAFNADVGREVADA